jgi:hypothetical protein
MDYIDIDLVDETQLGFALSPEELLIEEQEDRERIEMEHFEAWNLFAN